VAYFGIDGQPCLRKEGYAGWHSEYDDKDNEIRVAYFGIDGQPCVNDDGYAGWHSEYDDKDNEIRVAYFGIDGQPCLNDDGYAGYTSEYDDQGNGIRRTFFGRDGHPTALGGDDPYDSWEKTWHANGKVAIWTWFYHLASGKNDCSKEVRTYDEEGNWIKTEYFDVNGNPISEIQEQ